MHNRLLKKGTVEQEKVNEYQQFFPNNQVELLDIKEEYLKAKKYYLKNFMSFPIRKHFQNFAPIFNQTLITTSESQLREDVPREQSLFL